jgi:putative restriction endonuclease
MAWETFGTGNGAASYDEMRSAIARYRDGDVGPSTNIGCRILVEPTFFPKRIWLDLPQSWARNIVGGKRYSTDEADGLDLWNRLQEATQDTSLGAAGGFAETAARFGEPRLIVPRLGQGAFRIAVTETYRRQCAVSEGKVLPALDAAHIRPYSEGGLHSKTNGILMRKDIHSVFDAGYATVDVDYKFVVSKRVKEVFQNGE